MTNKKKGNKGVAAIATPKLKYNPAGDAIALAYDQWTQGNKKLALQIVAHAMSIEGMDIVASSLKQINDEIEEANLGGEGEGGEGTEQAPTPEPTPAPEPTHAPEEKSTETQAKTDKVTSSTVKVEKKLEDKEDNSLLSFLDSDDESLADEVLAEYDDEDDKDEDTDSDDEDDTDSDDDEDADEGEGEEDTDDDSDDEEDDSDEDEDEDEDDSEEDKIGKSMEKANNFQSLLDHITVANRASLKGDEGARKVGNRILKDVA